MILRAKVGESNGESNCVKKTTFATKCMKLLAKVKSESGGESGESGMSKCLKSLKSKAKVFLTPKGVAAAQARLPEVRAL